MDVSEPNNNNIAAIIDKDIMERKHYTTDNYFPIIPPSGVK